MLYQKMKPLPDGRATLKPLVLGRVSTPGQDINNIEAGYRYAERSLADIWEGECIIRRLGEQGSGMLVDRETILEAYRMIEAGEVDVILMEDLSKAYRNPRWIVTFVQDCFDAGVRVIAPGDSMDTYDDNWEVALQTAALRHGLHIPDTRRRIRRTASQSFEKGGMVQRVRYGYIKLTKKQADEATHGPKGLRMAKDPGAAAVIEALRQKVVVEGKGVDELAEWLNTHGLDGKGVPTGPYAKSGRWTGSLLSALLRDPILFGLRQYPKVNHQPLFRTGKCRRSKNPSPQRQLYAELAHMTEAQWLEMVAALDQIAGEAKAAQKAGPSNPRYRVARQDSLTGLQHAVCGVCGAVMYPVGNGQLKCSKGIGRMPDNCWNHVQVPLARLRKVLVDKVLEKLGKEPKAMEVLLEQAWIYFNQARAHENMQLASVEKEIADLQEQVDHLTEVVATKGGKLESLLKKLKTLETALKAAKRRRAETVASFGRASFPADKQQFRLDPQAVLLELADCSFAFAALMRKIFKIVIQPVQDLAHGQVRPRALITLDLRTLCGSGDGGVPRVFTVDLFEPPEHIKHLQAILDLQAEKRSAQKKESLKVLARELKIGHMTVKRAMDYYRKMQQAGVSEPYVVLTQRPASASRWKSKPPGSRRAKRQQSKGGAEAA